MTLIDSAEMYGEGAAEHLVGQAIRGYDRERLYLVSKVYPFHAGRHDIFQSCENSLRRMGTDYLDLYLLHWRGSVPLAETVACMEELKAKGRIRSWGVSNLDTADMEELFEVTGGTSCLTDQVLYHLGSRGVEYDLLPWLRRHKMPLMAYCPLAQGGGLRRGLLASPAVRAAAQAHGGLRLPGAAGIFAGAARRNAHSAQFRGETHPGECGGAGHPPDCGGAGRAGRRFPRPEPSHAAGYRINQQADRRPHRL